MSARSVNGRDHSGECIVDDSPRNSPTKIANEWRTETKSSFRPPQDDEVQLIGRRRELVKKYLNLLVSKETVDEMIAGVPLENDCFTEYIDNYCDINFTPLMDHPEYDESKFLKYPLYAGGARTFYKEQLDRGNMAGPKKRRNFIEPFRRNSRFTTPIELALEDAFDEH
ncbi:uncharacterized protein LOC105703024 [Orussus abietinus]|uniref:uncharacterized protein LOC105703024 n=1 Tax=Orussus abietinus TaxID=222816 RepID=UPI000626D588|nr:uncharacterized protein LOC105703024 [Orussus abietinus]